MILNQLNRKVAAAEREVQINKTSYKLAKAHTSLSIRTVATRPSSLVLSFASGLAWGLIQKQPPGENTKSSKKTQLSRVFKLAGKIVFTRVLASFAGDLA